MSSGPYLETIPASIRKHPMDTTAKAVTGPMTGKYIITFGVETKAPTAMEDSTMIAASSIFIEYISMRSAAIVEAMRVTSMAISSTEIVGERTPNQIRLKGVTVLRVVDVSDL